MNARVQHRVTSSRASSSPQRRPDKPSGFDRVRQALDNHLAKAAEARKRLLDGPYDPKLLHAWRVNLRRVTATLKDVAALSDDDLDDVLAYLRVCREATGQCRDIDILAQETLPTFLDKEHGKLMGADDVRETLLALQQAQHEHAHTALKKHSLAMSLRAWNHWAQSLEPPSDRHMRHMAAAALEQRYATLRKRAQKLDGGQKRLHRLRSATKKLRYAVELYEHAFPKQATAAWLKRLADLQGHLGVAHDRMMGAILMKNLVSGDEARSRLKPFRQWSKRTAFEASEKALASLAKLEKLKVYWRPEAH